MAQSVDARRLRESVGANENAIVNIKEYIEIECNTPHFNSSIHMLRSDVQACAQKHFDPSIHMLKADAPRPTQTRAAVCTQPHFNSAIHMLRADAPQPCTTPHFDASIHMLRSEAPARCNQVHFDPRVHTRIQADPQKKCTNLIHIGRDGGKCYEGTAGLLLGALVLFAVVRKAKEANNKFCKGLKKVWDKTFNLQP